ncbi:DUF1428 family protein [Aquibacillus salsiterrae]|uniref:DUF1428 family protein n=1 Tax=Aquibacillus salsiterrae TaxID=2950439 RepID=A0A9X3WH65_9BACI|nr:DUF1428 family protein [Aquibacillus salsiterrae]MDC3418533.1 DUF1428 family protein [Aquibacillus salsiterrae]
MYTNLYFYLVSSETIDEFMELRHQISDIMLAYGTLEDRVYTTVTEKDSDLHKRFFTILNAEPDEQIILRQTVYRNFSHYVEICEQTKEDDTMKTLTNSVNQLVHGTKMVSASFLCE